MTLQMTALQDLAHLDGVCYGCGRNHPTGLRIKSRWHEDGVHVIARHLPRDEFAGWSGLVYGGLLAMLVDCHSNWTAMAYHIRNEQLELEASPPVHCVTAHLGLDYLMPTPMGTELLLRARVEGELGRKTRVLCEVLADGKTTVKADSIFVRVNMERFGQAKADEAR